MIVVCKPFSVPQPIHQCWYCILQTVRMRILENFWKQNNRFDLMIWKPHRSNHLDDDLMVWKQHWSNHLYWTVFFFGLGRYFHFFDVNIGLELVNCLRFVGVSFTLRITLKNIVFFRYHKSREFLFQKSYCVGCRLAETKKSDFFTNRPRCSFKRWKLHSLRCCFKKVVHINGKWN